ncbi:MAG: tetraacyldisaccharide 4'-kinase [Proteobacteria bacterium]|nr:tetraacyldisaccharide 4'-kinase [Pseudomonadota bacterium]
MNRCLAVKPIDSTFVLERKRKGKASFTGSGASILAWLFGLLVQLRNAAFDLGLVRSRRLPGKVISIGNIAVGGTGKSPMVIAVAGILQSKMCSAVVLTRGYKGGLKGGQWVCFLDGKRVAGNADVGVRPDEALMQSAALRGVPVVVGAKRRQNALQWLKYCEQNGGAPPKVWILDDGFQHRWIARDLDIVLIDASKPFGSLLPKGLFREPSEALQRAHVVVFTRATDLVPRPGDFSYPTLVNSNAIVTKARVSFGSPKMVWPTKPESVLPIVFTALAGIAHPKQFRDAISSKSLKIEREYFVGDHELFDEQTLKTIFGDAATPVITTEKDWARSEEVLKKLDVPIYILPMQMEVPPELSAELTEIVG